MLGLQTGQRDPERVTPWRIVRLVSPSVAGTQARRASTRRRFRGLARRPERVKLPHLGPATLGRPLHQQHLFRVEPRPPPRGPARRRPGGFRGMTSTSPADAWQSPTSGHPPQRGRGVQTSAPSSISAWLKSPTRFAGNSASASRHSRFCVADDSDRRRSRRAGSAAAGCWPPGSAAEVESLRQDGVRGVAAEARQSAHGVRVARQLPAWRRRESRPGAGRAPGDSSRGLPRDAARRARAGGEGGEVGEAARKRPK